MNSTFKWNIAFIILEKGKNGIREQGEIDCYRDEKVRATGIIHPMAAAWGDGSASSVIGPCLTDILLIEEQ